MANASRGVVWRATRSDVPRCSSVAKSLVFVATLLIASRAKADVSSWLYLGGGATYSDTSRIQSEVVPSLRFATGMGTDPAKPWIVGGLFRVETLIGRGSDLSAVLRLTEHGFVNGKWGVALDLGGVARYWGNPDVYGGTGTIVLGGPWGLELDLGGMVGNHDSRAVSATLGIDLARLTVYRQSGSSWWKNTFPAVRSESGQ